MKAGLIADTYLYAMHIEQEKKSYSDYHLTEQMVDKVKELSQGLYNSI